MSVWTDFIAINETEIVRLRLHIEEMAAGTIEMRALDHGKWVLRNAEWASEDRSTIDRLTAMVARAKTELGVG